MEKILFWVVLHWKQRELQKQKKKSSSHHFSERHANKLRANGLWTLNPDAEATWSAIIEEETTQTYVICPL